MRIPIESPESDELQIRLHFPEVREFTWVIPRRMNTRSFVIAHLMIIHLSGMPSVMGDNILLRKSTSTKHKTELKGPIESHPKIGARFDGTINKLQTRVTGPKLKRAVR